MAPLLEQEAIADEIDLVGENAVKVEKLLIEESIDISALHALEKYGFLNFFAVAEAYFDFEVEGGVAAVARGQAPADHEPLTDVWAEELGIRGSNVVTS